MSEKVFEPIFPVMGKEDLEIWIQRRAIEMAAAEGFETDIPCPSVMPLRERSGFVHWVLSDYQNSRGIGAIRIAAAEASAKFDLER